MPFLGADFLATLPGLFSDDVATSVAALRRSFGLTTSAEPTPEDCVSHPGLQQRRTAAGSAGDAEPYRSTHDDLLRRLTKPVLITHGLDDRVVLPAMSDHHAALIPHAKTSYYEGIGHSPFREDPERFNAELLAFASAL